jgi:WD40 repeat protein
MANDSTSSPPSGYFVTGGTLSAKAESYVARAADETLYQDLLAGQFCFVLNARQMGKSSICVRTMQRLGEAGVKTAFVDLTRIGGRNVNPEQWYAGVLGEIGRGLGLRAELFEFYKSRAELGPMQRAFQALREVALEKLAEPIVIFFDEIDATRSLSFDTDEFFAAIRECHNRRVLDPAYLRLTFCLLGVAVPSDLIKNPASTPFNVGVRIDLRDFTKEEARQFARGILEADAQAGRAPRDAARLVDAVHAWTNGHPFLTQSLCQAIAADPAIQKPAEVDALVARELLEPKARDTNVNLADVANRALNAGAAQQDPERFRADLLSLYLAILRGQKVVDDEGNHVSAMLKLSGLAKTEGNYLVVRNKVYRTVFGRAWVHDNMPGQEVRRQRRAFFLGALRVAIAASAVVALVGALAFTNFRLAEDRERARRFAEYESYVAKVNLMRSASENNDNRLLGHLLEATRQSPFRGPEWHYWDARLHDADAEIPFPTGFSRASIAPDGNSVAISDYTEGFVRLYSLPELRPIAKEVPISREDYVLNEGEGWAMLKLGDKQGPHVVSLADGSEIGRISFNPRSVVSVTLVPGDHDFALMSRGDLDSRSRTLTIWNEFGQLKGELELRNTYLAGLATTDAGATREAAPEAPLPAAPPESDQTPGRPEPNPASPSPTTPATPKPPATPDDASREPVPVRVGELHSTELVVRDVKTGRELDRSTPPMAPKVSCLSSQGHLLAYCLPDGNLFVRDVDRHITVFHQLMDRPCINLRGLKFSHDDQRLLTVSTNLAAALWDISRQKMLASWSGAFNAVDDPKGRFVLVLGNGARLYKTSDLNHERGIPTTRLPGPATQLVGPRPNGELLVNSENHALAWQPFAAHRPGGDVSQSLRERGTPSLQFSFRRNPNGRMDAVPTPVDRMLRLSKDGGWRWSGSPLGLTDFGSTSAEPGQNPARHLRGPDGVPSHFDATRDGSAFAFSILGEGNIFVLDGNGHELWRTLFGRTIIADLTWSPNGQLLAAAAYDGSTKVYSLSGKMVANVPNGGSRATAVGFDPSSRWLAIGYEDGNIDLYELNRSARPIRSIGHVNDVRSLVFTANGRRLLSASGDGTTRLWDWRNGTEVLQIPNGPAGVVGARFAVDEAAIVTADELGNLKRYDLRPRSSLK